MAKGGRDVLPVVGRRSGRRLLEEGERMPGRSPSKALGEVESERRREGGRSDWACRREEL